MRLRCLPSLFFITTLILFLSLATTGCWQEKNVDFRSSKPSILMSYPASFQKDLSSNTLPEGFILKLTRDDPTALFSIRYEDRLGMLKLIGKSILEQLEEQVNLRYPSYFPEYKKESFSETIVANEKAAIFTFTYRGNDNKTLMRQRLTIIVKGTTAYYLSAQSTAEEFSLSEKDFDKMTKSFSIE